MLVHRTGGGGGQGVREREASRCQDRGQRDAAWLWPLRGSAASCFGLRVFPGLTTKPALVQVVVCGLQFLAAQSSPEALLSCAGGPPGNRFCALGVKGHHLELPGRRSIGGTRHIWWAATQNQAPKIALAGPLVSVLTALRVSSFCPPRGGRLGRHGPFTQVLRAMCSGRGSARI